MEWNQFKLKVSNDNLSKNVNWYDILKCNLYDSTEQVSFIYLPAAFLKQKGILPQMINLGDKKQYMIDFDDIKINELTIDEYFDECITRKEKVQYNILVKYCRFLYRTKTGLKDDFGREIDQALIQFKKEFKDFYLFIVDKELKYRDSLFFCVNK